MRLAKDLAVSLVIQAAPPYVEFLRLIAKPEGWQVVANRFSTIKQRLKLGAYVRLYDTETAPLISLAIGFLGTNGVKEIAQELQSYSSEEQQVIIDAWAEELDRVLTDDLMESLFPDTPEKEAKALATFNSLPDDEKKEAVFRAQHLYGATFCMFYDAIAVMVHGEKLTSLVPKALAGDTISFAKAVHIDKSLLYAHPKFLERWEAAQSVVDNDFIKAVTYRLNSPITKGPIAYPGAYMVFALLESLNWLDDLTHSEILDICDAAQLDRWQERIEDVNYITKRLISYRQMQKSGGMSMR